MKIDDKIQSVWDYYRNHHPRCRKSITSKSIEYRKIKAALDEGFEINEICEAIDGFHLSPFHQGDNPQGVTYLGIKTILRDADQIERGREIFASPPRSMGTLERSTRKIMKDWGHGQSNIS